MKRPGLFRDDRIPGLLRDALRVLGRLGGDLEVVPRERFFRQPEMSRRQGARILPGLQMLLRGFQRVRLLRHRIHVAAELRHLVDGHRNACGGAFVLCIRLRDSSGWFGRRNCGLYSRLRVKWRERHGRLRFLGFELQIIEEKADFHVCHAHAELGNQFFLNLGKFQTLFDPFGDSLFLRLVQIHASFIRLLPGSSYLRKGCIGN